KRDLIGGADRSCPTMLNYETYSKNNSLYNTPPSFSIYVTKLVLEWLKEQGGVSAIEEQNRMKSLFIIAIVKPAGPKFFCAPAYIRPNFETSYRSEKLDYVHITTNNTIEGTKYVDIPHVDKVPLVADMSSNILSERYDVSKFGLIIAIVKPAG
ncbi:hypothetical protein ACT453_20770, partial [Bacillus sp. D-CC]